MSPAPRRALAPEVGLAHLRIALLDGERHLLFTDMRAGALVIARSGCGARGRAASSRWPQILAGTLIMNPAHIAPRPPIKVISQR